ncbi:L(+)-tartrate dehydratase subunit alpha [Tepidanaerobacter sp. EBM-38]|uniref:L(+)-tartrate dehydratase subunit alpha n=1 Tax=Tepidanaerobacter sp. EBM-38 TaxID=1918496 RepID=UPI000A7FE130|nr:L(+)-tartrate dehydratase subunit alpha [Tepidanaerobacter sp. EBM-38]
MDRAKQVQEMTETIAKFIAYFGKVLPDDIQKKLKELEEAEVNPIAKLTYETMFRNQELALKLNRPSCQDTGVIQFFARVGTKFPLIDDLPEIFKNSVLIATKCAPLRHNAVETFDEYNTGCNVGYRVPSIDWEIIPNSDELNLDIYMAGGGCSLPGRGMVLMPSAGYEGVTKFVLDIMTSYGLNACPPLLVGVGIATSIETAAVLSKKALMRPLGTKNPNERAAMMEEELERGINAIGLGPQGLSGNNSVMGVHIENAARHPSTIGVAVNTGCWSHRRGNIIFHSDFSYTITSHKEAII